MTISYPRALPSTKVLRVNFEHDPQQMTYGEASGRTLGVQVGPAIWKATYETTPASEVEFSKWRAWLDSLDGVIQEFYAYDVRRPLPWNYRNGFAGLVRAVSGTAFDGTSTSWSVNSPRDEITIGAAAGQQLPVGFSMIEGDYIGLKWLNGSAPRRSLHRVVEQFNANGSGVGTWTVRPSISPDVPGGATVNLIKPECLMVVTRRDRQAEGKSRSISFDAEQNLEF